MPLRPAATASSMVPAAALPRRDAEKNARAQPRIAQPHAPLITHAPRAVHVRCRACDFSIWLRRHASKKNGKIQKLEFLKILCRRPWLSNGAAVDQGFCIHKNEPARRRLGPAAHAAPGAMRCRRAPPRPDRATGALRLGAAAARGRPHVARLDHIARERSGGGRVCGACA